ncbi:MAG: tyrosine-type recombinase/integrase [bacterium]|nr:tyrosine-type recombinase/integrase [bacterium]
MRLPNGYGGVVNLGKHRRKPFAARVTADWTLEGKAIYKYIGYYATRKEALQALADFNAKPYNLDGNKMTFAEVYKLATEKEFENCSKQKLYAWQSAFKNCSAIHDMKISQLKTLELQQVVDNATVRSRASLNNIIVVMHAVFKFALQNDYIQKDYSQFVVIGKTDDKKEKTPFSEEEIQNLWDKPDRDWVDNITLILIYTGFRINELLTLKSENVHIKEKYFQGGLKTKSGKNRIVPIHNRILPLVEVFYNKHMDYFITNNKNKQVKYDHFAKVFSERYGHSPHETRHTTASLLTKYNAKDIYIKKILGHSAQDLTKDVYTHIELEQLLETINLIPGGYF